MSSSPRTSPLASRWAPLAVLLLGAACTAVVTRQLDAAGRERDQQRFEIAARRLQAAVEQRAGSYGALARATARLLASHDGYAGPDEFRRFLEVVRPSDCPGVAGVVGVGYCRRALPGELPHLIDEARRRNDPAFDVTPAGPPRREYFPVVLLEPGGPGGTRDGRALGYDPFTDPACRAAMEQARDTGAAAASAVVTAASPPAREEDGAGRAAAPSPAQPTLLIFVPVYRKDARPADPEARRNDLRGLAYVAIRAADSFDWLRTDPGPGAPADAGFTVRDGPIAAAADSAPRLPAVASAVVPADAGLLYRSPGYESAAGHSRFTATLPVTIAGRTWALTAVSTPAFEARVGPGRVLGVPAAMAVAAGGAAVSLLLAGLTWLQVRARAAAAAAAARLDATLRQAQAAREQAEAARDRSDRSREHAEGAGRVKDEFLATLSHELRTPLNAILGWAQLLRRQAGLDPEVEEGLAVIERNARVQSQLVSDLLDMSRIIAGKVRLDLQPVDLSAVAAAAADSIRPAAEARGITVERAAPTPAGSVDLTVWGDPARLQQVAWNLLTNAVKFTPEGGRVRIAVARDGGPLAPVVLTVADTGEGIPPAFLPHLFDRFSQADASTTRRHGGLGLGLAVVKHLTELHGGRVRAASPGPGAGSTFTVELPPAQSRPPLETPDAPGVPEASGSSAGPRAAPAVPRMLVGLTVLVVDDEPDARDLARRVLSEAGAAVLLARGADEALNLVRARRPDVLVGDIGMPGRDGFALARALRALPPGEGGTTPAVALTAFAGEDDGRRVLAAGYHVHLPKPAEAVDLVTAVARLAGRAAAGGPSRPEAAATRRQRLGLDD